MIPLLAAARSRMSLTLTRRPCLVATTTHWPCKGEATDNRNTTSVPTGARWFHDGNSGSAGGESSASSGSDQHAFFQEQMQEWEAERTSVLGASDDPTTHGDNTDHPWEELSKSTTTTTNQQQQEEDITMMEDLYMERDALFQFTREERQAWSNHNTTSGGVLSSSLLEEIELARKAQHQREQQGEDISKSISTTTILQGEKEENDKHGASSSHESFTHVSSDGSSVHMVHVGDKQVTSRMAHARTKVWLPPDVWQAFGVYDDDETTTTTKPPPTDLIGKKGPILATAQLAGIMATKKTSELIPLCHPLPLEQVSVDLSLDMPHVVIDCIAKVTHKTGVEMEAMTGATVAALTIYDMVKAVSHQVEIQETKLIRKSGGKRHVDNR